MLGHRRGNNGSAPGDAVLLTGATGFLGMELLCRFLERDDRHVYALVRAEDDAQAEERIRGVIEELMGDPDAHGGRWTAVPGDIEARGLGLGRGRRQRLAAAVGTIAHSAASVSFSLPLDDSRRINVTGTRRVLEFASQAERAGGLRRFVHVSTAYVAGDHTGVFSEDQLDVGQGFRNSYERSKFEAERLVRSFVHRFPVQIFRPSIIVGEASSGWTASFNVLYPPLRAFEAGTIPVLPARASTPVDVVPVDYVADGIYELASQPAEGAEVHHLVAGRLATTVGRLAQRASNFFERRPPRIVHPRAYQLLHPLLLRVNRGRRRRALRRTEDLFPYFSMRVRFDDRRARARLQSAGIDPPAPDSYFDRLLSFAVASRWGKRRLSRADAHRRRARWLPSPNI